MAKEKNVPEIRFSTGVINATVWKNQAKNKAGEDIEFRNITLERRYKDKDDQWKSTNNFGINHLPQAVLVLQEAYRYLTLKEKTDNGDNEEISEEEVL